MSRRTIKYSLNKLIIPHPWLILWSCIYVAILTLGLLAPNGSSITFIKLVGIFLCFIYTAWVFPKDHLLQLAFLITSIADIILAIDNTLVIGVVVFFLAQLIHLARLDWHTCRCFVAAIIPLFLLAVLLNLKLNFAPLMYIVSSFYLITLLTNIIISLRWYRREPTNLLAFLALVGFILFLACDICTGVSYLSRTAVLPALLYTPANFFAWAFYYPSQIFISNSSKCVKIVTKDS